MSLQKLNCVVTGANRGIGLGLVQQLLSQQQHSTVFALCRNPNSATSLTNLSNQYPNRIHIIECDVSSSTSTSSAAFKVGSIDPTGIDIVIANAGIANPGLIATTPAETFLEVLKVNTMGPVHTFQAFYPLLKQKEMSKFFVISSELGSSKAAPSRNTTGTTAYGMSKSAANYFVQCVAREHAKEGIIAMAICPGWVDTDMGHEYAKQRGRNERPSFTLEESVVPLVQLMLGATKENSGQYVNRLGERIPF
ncbi:hypothetical protein HK097_011340 [Rhizophlyctis rosea]|uniref:NAD(P)-binding protein n=1 Tax=Rhizophlyctis rosea TaxID=64517 RepID=A0AAD5S8W5_9FUNG|nr:hypothetical protein HK097_011340 [Rhizophlyctis rosea]